ncbi:MAG: hypothetical protein GF331_22320 [Chitinivibrionales bacterium]|nr:hypothetical protein [Chitinivibrionales bacterium]
MNRTSFFIILLALVCRAEAAEVTVNLGQTFQTIDGFGAFNSIEQLKVKQGPFYVDAPMENHYDSLVHDLGITIVRTFPPSDVNRGTDGHFEFDGAHGGLTTRNLSAFKDRGVNTFFTSVLSPPGYMKTNGITTQGGHLKPEHYNDFADYCIDYINWAKTTLGIDFHGISLQNELGFSQPYASCIYTPQEFVAVVNAVAPRFAQAGLTTKIYGPETMGTMNMHHPGGLGYYLPELEANAQARNTVGLLPVHGYLDGVAPDYGSAPGWEAMAAAAGRLGVPLWMTETGGWDGDWPGAMKWATAIHLALKHGNIGAWIWYRMSADEADARDFMAAGKPTLVYFVHKHYYRFVRPGAVMVGASSNDPDVLVTAYHHKENDCVTIVAINHGNTTPFSLSGSGLPQTFEVFQTSQLGRRCEMTGTLSPGQSFELPPSSITTFVSGTYRDEKPTSSTQPFAPTILKSKAVQMHRGEYSRHNLSGRVLYTPWPLQANQLLLRQGTKSITLISDKGHRQ